MATWTQEDIDTVDWVVERVGITVRLTEDGQLRMLEGDLGYRIIEFIEPPGWAVETIPPTTLT